MKVNKCSTKYCDGCQNAWLCYGVDTDQCLTYAARKKEAEEKEERLRRERNRR